MERGCTVETDFSGRFTEVSEEFATRLGYRKRELIGLDMAELLHRDDKPRILSIFFQAIKRGESMMEARARLVCKDGSILKIHAVPYFHISKDGDIRAVTKVQFLD